MAGPLGDVTWWHHFPIVTSPTGVCWVGDDARRAVPPGDVCTHSATTRKPLYLNKIALT